MLSHTEARRCVPPPFRERGGGGKPRVSVVEGVETLHLDDDSTAIAALAADAHNGASMPTSTQRERLLDLVRRFAGKRILVVGDMVADEYITGTPMRISREAPVLILDHADQFTGPGRATTPPVNARTLGAEVFLPGVVADDGPGSRLRQCLATHRLAMDGLFSDQDRLTPTKTRIRAAGTQVVLQ